MLRRTHAADMMGVNDTDMAAVLVSNQHPGARKGTLLCCHYICSCIRHVFSQGLLSKRNRVAPIDTVYHPHAWLPNMLPTLGRQLAMSMGSTVPVKHARLRLVLFHKMMVALLLVADARYNDGADSSIAALLRHLPVLLCSYCILLGINTRYIEHLKLADCNTVAPTWRGSISRSVAFCIALASSHYTQVATAGARHNGGADVAAVAADGAHLPVLRLLHPAGWSGGPHRRLL